MGSTNVRAGAGKEGEPSGMAFGLGEEAEFELPKAVKMFGGWHPQTIGQSGIEVARFITVPASLCLLHGCKA